MTSALSVVGDIVSQLPDLPPNNGIYLVPWEQITLSTARRWLVKDLIPRVGMTVVWGPPKCGKSFWVFDLMMHVALGWTYRGRRVNPGPVVYCAFEGQAGIEARVAAFKKTYLARNEEQVPFYLEPVNLDLIKDHKALISAIEQHLGEITPVAVILDTLNRSLAGSESDDKDMSAYVRAADAIKVAFNCAVIIVHHCGHNETRPRGHTALIGALDAQIAVARDAANNIRVKVELMKDGAQGDEIVSKLSVVEVGIDDDGEVITSCSVEEVTGALARPAQAGWTRGLQIFRDAIDAALIEQAVNHTVAGDGPQVRAVTIAAVRGQYMQRYVSRGEGDPSGAAARQAWKRAFDDARARRLIGAAPSNGMELVWLMAADEVGRP